MYLILSPDGSVWTAGENDRSQLSGDTVHRPTFTKVQGLPTVKEISPGFYHCIVLTEDGEVIMMTSSNGNISRVTVPLCGEFTGQRWIPLTKASEAELGCFLWSEPKQTFEETIERPVIWDAIAPIMTSL